MSAAESVKVALTPKRTVEHSAYIGMLRRMIRAGGRRIGDGDEVDLAEFITLQATLDEAVAESVRGLRARGESWAYIARGLGTSRQAAQMRFGHLDR